MTFISNVTFRPLCEYCKGTGARLHSWRGWICPDCNYAARFRDSLYHE